MMTTMEWVTTDPQTGPGVPILRVRKIDRAILDEAMIVARIT